MIHNTGRSLTLSNSLRQADQATAQNLGNQDTFNRCLLTDCAPEFVDNER